MDFLASLAVLASGSFSFEPLPCPMAVFGYAGLICLEKKYVGLKSLQQKCTRRKPQPCSLCFLPPPVSRETGWEAQSMANPLTSPKGCPTHLADNGDGRVPQWFGAHCSHSTHGQHTWYPLPGTAYAI
jgi:hypothetical protein